MSRHNRDERYPFKVQPRVSSAALALTTVEELPELVGPVYWAYADAGGGVAFGRAEVGGGVLLVLVAGPKGCAPNVQSVITPEEVVEAPDEVRQLFERCILQLFERSLDQLRESHENN
jgi:hypothetical protein